MQHNLRRLGELRDFKVAENDPDVRGWGVKTPDGRAVGEVEELIVDPDARKVRYLEVGLDRQSFGLQNARRVSIPVESAQVSHREHSVTVSGLSRDAIGGLPESEYVATRDTRETTQRDRMGRNATERDATGDRDAVMTRAEEELRVGTRRATVGEVVVGKHVETEHVTEPIEVERERAHVERRPVQGNARDRDVHINQDQVRIPITEEELVVEKRPVVKEELIVSKDKVRETEHIEDDLRKERFDVRKEGRISEDPDFNRRGGR